MEQSYHPVSIVVLGFRSLYKILIRLRILGPRAETSNINWAEPRIPYVITSRVNADTYWL